MISVTNSLVFQTALKISIASVFAIPASSGAITDVENLSRALRYGRSLTQYSAAVHYIVTAVNSISSSVLTSTLDTAGNSGKLTKAMQASSPVFASVTADTAPSVIDVSPTSSPTMLPSLSPTIATVSKSATTSSAVIGLAVVVGIMSLIMMFLVFYIYQRRKSLSSPATIHSSS